jgi:hypothetical protein
MNVRRRWPLRRLAFALAICLPIAAWVATLDGGLILGAGPRGEGCRSFWGESVAGVAWSPGGSFLVATTVSTAEGDTGDAAVRVFRWPGMDLVSRSTAVTPDNAYSIDDRGVLTWVWDSMSPLSPDQPMRLDPGGVPTHDDRTSPIGASRRVRAIADASSLGILAKGSAPGPGRPNQLCVRESAAG